MSLTDGDVAALARQAVDLLDPEIAIDLEPADSADPYRWGRHAWLVWPLIDGTRSFGIYLSSVDTPVDALRRLLDQLASDVPETARFRGQPFPPCAAGHPHPADVAGEDEWTIVLRCPRTGEVVRRVVPDLPN
jgi:hypothetical protein